MFFYGRFLNAVCKKRVEDKRANLGLQKAFYFRKEDFLEGVDDAAQKTFLLAELIYLHYSRCSILLEIHLPSSSSKILWGNSAK